MKRDDKIARYIVGELSVEDERAFKALLSRDAALRADVEMAQFVADVSKDVVADEVERRLDPFFADRLMKRISSDVVAKSRQEEFVNGLVRWFSPVSVVSLAIIFVLVAGSLASGPRNSSVAESLFGLPAVTVANVYDLDFE